MKEMIIIASVCLLAACTAHKKPAAGACDVTGTFRDFSELDGCSWLIELENGDRLSPVGLKTGFPLTDGLKVSFSYKVVQGMMSICMAEKAFVEVTCIEELNTSGQSGNCTDTMNPFAIDWMNKAFDKHNPTQIIKYRNQQEWAYLFYAIPDSFLYDCKGNLICKTHGDITNGCYQQYIKRFGRGKIIWQGEGVWD